MAVLNALSCFFFLVCRKSHEGQGPGDREIQEVPEQGQKGTVQLNYSSKVDSDFWKVWLVKKFHATFKTSHKILGSICTTLYTKNTI